MSFYIPAPSSFHFIEFVKGSLKYLFMWPDKLLKSGESY